MFDTLKNGQKKFLFTKIFIFALLFYYDFDLLTNINNLNSYIENEKQIQKIENYFKFCNDFKSKKIRRFKKMKKPEVSIISPLYNRERYILRILRSIQYQTFHNIEIILVDDNSIDNSVQLIEELQQIDQRIILIKNKKTKGTFVTRNIGVQYSSGKYITIPDPDDILSKDIVRTCYLYAEKFKYELIRFNSYLGEGKLGFQDLINITETGPVYQPKLSSEIFYGSKELQMVDYYVYNKFILKDVYIKALNSLNKFYSNMYMIYMEDQVMNYLLHRIAKSFYFLKVIGYYHLSNSVSIMNNLFKIPELRMKFSFIYLKFIFDYSKNTKFEKDMANHLFTILNKQFNIAGRLQANDYEENDYNLYYDIVNTYLNCSYIDTENKYFLNNFKFIIEKKNISYQKNLAKMKNITNITNITSHLIL
jgi:glycosyltransferase involved in cell wall biosynthesis